MREIHVHMLNNFTRLGDISYPEKWLGSDQNQVRKSNVCLRSQLSNIVKASFNHGQREISH